MSSDRAKLVSLEETVEGLCRTLTLHEAEIKDSSLTWHVAQLASTRAVASSDRAKLVSLEETIAGLHRTLASHGAG